ncbi:molybdopterin molybdotransferase MoeA [Nocardia zapadnayensis]|nr:gephyrin-like molybdotransferase Glp [Nocardia zapadnayensis]MCX0277011.1 molybdopterin molybdotransferase MoeA [Nocardia zapadnayensis]
MSSEDLVPFAITTSLDGMQQTPPESAHDPNDAWDSPRGLTAHCEAVRAALAARTPRTETVPLTAALHRSLARDAVASIALPPFDNSQMDGFAAASADTPGRLPVAATIAAGHVPAPLAPGTAAPIMTGAPVPAGADTVVPVEDTRDGRFDVAEVVLPASAPGRFVRPAGSDVAVGDTVLTAGTRLGPAALGLLAALGRTDVTVRARPQVLVCTGGDEVVLPGQPLPEGRIYDANTALLHAVLTGCGAEVCATRLVADSPDDFADSLHADIAAHDPDLVVTSGGISAGRFEVVRSALAAEPAVRFGSVAMQPGGPQGLGVLRGGIPIVCLPGNPVSTWVSAVLLLGPALAEVWGTTGSTARQARLETTVTPLAAKTQIRRGIRVPAAPDRVDVLPGTSSHLLAEAARAEVLVLVPPGPEPLPAGTAVEVVDL